MSSREVRNRVPTPLLTMLVLVLAALTVTAVVAGLILVRQPRLEPIPVPSVSQI